MKFGWPGRVLLPPGWKLPIREMKSPGNHV
jgi:hypothetical protein